MSNFSNAFTPNAEAIAVALLGPSTSRTKYSLRWGRKGSLAVNISGKRAGRFHDFENGTGGDLVDLVQYVNGSTRAGALAWLREFSNTAPLSQKQDVELLNNLHSRPSLRWSPKAQRIWEHTVSVPGTLGEIYQRGRCCYVPEANDLRFAHAFGPYPPSLVARVTDFLSGAPMSLFFVQLDAATGMKLAKRNLGDHAVSGGVVRLSPCVEVGGSLGLAEGIETALSVIAEGRGPVWATLATETSVRFSRPASFRRSMCGRTVTRPV